MDTLRPEGRLTIHHLVQLRQSAAAQEQHADFLERTVCSRSRGVSRAQHAVADLSRRVARLRRESAALCVRSERVAPGRVTDAPPRGRSPESRLRTGLTGASIDNGTTSSRIASLASAPSAFLHPGATESHGFVRLKQDADVFGLACDQALDRFEEIWEKAYNQTQSWARGIPESSYASSKDYPTKFRAAVETVVRVLDQGLRDPKQLGRAFFKVSPEDMDRLLLPIDSSPKASQDSGGGPSPLALFVSFVHAALGAQAALTFAEEVIAAVLQDQGHHTGLQERVVFVILDALEGLQSDTSVPGASSMLELSTAAELEVLAFLKAARREEQKRNLEHSQGAKDHVMPPLQAGASGKASVGTRGSTLNPAQGSIHALTTLGSSAAGLLQNGVSSSLSTFSGLFHQWDNAANQSDSVEQPPTSYGPGASPTPGLSRFVSSPTPSASSISSFDAQPTRRAAAGEKKNFAGIKEDLADVLSTANGSSMAERARISDGRRGLGRGHAPMHRPRTTSDRGGIRVVPSEPIQDGDPHPKKVSPSAMRIKSEAAARSAPVVLRALLMRTTPSSAERVPMVVQLSQRLLDNRFPHSATPEMHRRLKLLIVVRWYAFGHLRAMLSHLQHSAASASDASGYSQHFEISLKDDLVGDGVRLTRPRTSLLETAWMADLDTQRHLNTLHREMYSAIVGCVTDAADNSSGVEETRAAALDLVAVFVRGSGAPTSSPQPRIRIFSMSPNVIVAATEYKDIVLRIARGADDARSESARPEHQRSKDDRENVPSSVAQVTRALEDLRSFANSSTDAAEGGFFSFMVHSCQGPALAHNFVEARNFLVTTPSRVTGAHKSVSTSSELAKVDRPASMRASQSRHDVMAPEQSESRAQHHRLARSSDIEWIEEPSSPFHESLRPVGGSFFASTPGGTLEETSGASATQARSGVSSPVSRRSTTRKTPAPTSQRAASSDSRSPPTLEKPLLGEAPRLPSLPGPSIIAIERALATACRSGYVTMGSNPKALRASPSEILDEAAEAALASDRFDDAVTLRQSAEILSRAARRIAAAPHVAERLLLEPILDRLARPLRTAESARHRRTQGAHSAMQQLDARLHVIMIEAQALYKAIHELKTRVWYATCIRTLPNVIEARRTSQALLRSSSDRMRDAQRAATDWMRDMGIYDFGLATSCKVYLHALEPIFRAMSDDVGTLFSSRLWAREKDLARPFIGVGLDTVVTETHTDSQTVVDFGACPRSLIEPGKATPSLRVGLEEHFLQRVQLLCTGFFLSEALALLDLDAGDDTATSRRAEARSRPATTNSSLGGGVCNLGGDRLLRQFELVPSPRSKLRCLLLLERVVGALLRAPAAELASQTDASHENFEQSDQGLHRNTNGLDQANSGTQTPTLRGPVSPKSIQRPQLLRHLSDQGKLTATADPSTSSQPMSLRSGSRARRALSLYGDEDDRGSVSSGDRRFEAGSYIPTSPMALPSMHELLAGLSSTQARHSRAPSTVSTPADAPSRAALTADVSARGLAESGAASSHSDRDAPQQLGLLPSSASQSTLASLDEGLSSSVRRLDDEQRSSRGRAAADEREDIAHPQAFDEIQIAFDTAAGPVTDGYAPQEVTTDDMVAALEEVIQEVGLADVSTEANQSDTASDAHGEARNRDRRSLLDRGALLDRGELLLNLQVIAAFTPTTVLDLRDEGKAFWDLCLAVATILQPGDRGSEASVPGSEASVPGSEASVPGSEASVPSTRMQGDSGEAATMVGEAQLRSVGPEK